MPLTTVPISRQRATQINFQAANAAFDSVFRFVYARWCTAAGTSEQARRVIRGRIMVQGCKRRFDGRTQTQRMRRKNKTIIRTKQKICAIIIHRWFVAICVRVWCGGFLVQSGPPLTVAHALDGACVLGILSQMVEEHVDRCHRTTVATTPAFHLALESLCCSSRTCRVVFLVQLLTNEPYL